MKSIALILLGLLLPMLTLAQKHTITGHIRDADSGEALIGATVYVPTLDAGTAVNTYGFYSLTLPEHDSIAITISHLGYQPQIKKVYLTTDIKLDIRMSPSKLELEAVEVTAQAADRNVTRTQMGVVDVPIKLISELPVILGEPDILKVVQLLPGVQAGNEGTTGFHVRGGTADQNLILLDEATVYNPNHLFGLTSTFNTAAINNATLIKGGFPVQYGGRLSSILDITMKEGNNQKFQGDGSIGLISSRLTLEGPLVKGKSSYIVSGRRTYLDLLISPFLAKGVKTRYNFYDLNGKVNYELGKNDRVYFSVFKGNDVLDYEQAGIAYKVDFGNTTATLRWNHIFGPKLFANTSLIYNDYHNSLEALQNNVRSKVNSGIKDMNAKMEFQYYPSPSHTLRFGGIVQHHTLRSEGDARFQPGTKANPETTLRDVPRKSFNEAIFYLSDEMKLGRWFSANIGLRAPFYYADSVQFNRWEPRVSLKVKLDNQTSIKAAYTSMHQFLHLIPGSSASIPYDIWAPSTTLTQPQSSQQYAIGVFRNFKNNAYEASLEGYYKTMDNQVLFREGNQLATTLDIDQLLVYGKGWSYGGELLIKKNTGKLTGWLSYTLSWTNQKFPELNAGKTFPFRYDRRHNLSLVGNYALSDKWSLSAVFVFNTGAAFTVPTGRIAAQYGGSLFEGNYYLYEDRNNVRMDAYHRLDVSAIYKKKRKIFGHLYDSELVFGVYNLYSRQNPYFIYFEVDVNTDQPRAKQVSLLPIIPSISYNFKF
jgi:hypothetical protein